MNIVLWMKINSLKAIMGQQQQQGVTEFILFVTEICVPTILKYKSFHILI